MLILAIKILWFLLISAFMCFSFTLSLYNWTVLKKIKYVFVEQKSFFMLLCSLILAVFLPVQLSMGKHQWQCFCCCYIGKNIIILSIQQVSTSFLYSPTSPPKKTQNITDTHPSPKLSKFDKKHSSYAQNLLYALDTTRNSFLHLSNNLK